MRKLFLAAALALGLFPGSGLLFAKSSTDLKCKRLSLPSLYSYITAIARLILIAFGLCSLWGIMTSTVSFNVEKYTLITGCVTTFCNGFIFQIISVWRAKKFILLLQKLEEYDSQYPQKSRKRRYNAFTIYNVLFGIFVIVFPIFVVFSLWIKHFFPPKLVDGKVQMTPPVIHWEAVGPTVGMMSLCLMILEVATIYPIIQIGYFIKAIEYRMQEILEMIDTHVRPRTPQQYDLLFNIYKTGAWTGKSLEGTPNKMASRQISSPSQEFWKRLNHRYLDLLGVLDAFMQFAGLFFIVIFPLQIISSVCMFYCISAADIVMWCAVDNAVHLLLLLGLIKLWALCNAGHRMEKTHSLILRESLKVDADEIQDYNERTEYEKFGQMVRSIPVELSASGYFNVSRRNVPSIITALVSYIIVLLQFRTSAAPAGSSQIQHSFTKPNSSKST